MWYLFGFPLKGRRGSSFEVATIDVVIRDGQKFRMSSEEYVVHRATVAGEILDVAECRWKLTKHM
jgi:hypothetical protein